LLAVAHVFESGFQDAWRPLLIFGESDWANRASDLLLTVDSGDGAVKGLDVEREQPLFVFNSSLQRFIDTFHYLEDAIKVGRPLPPDAGVALEGIDATAYPNSEWENMIDYLLVDAPADGWSVEGVQVGKGSDSE
jgi:hypothetical protein